MGKRYDRDGYTNEIRISLHESEINNLIESMTLANQCETQRKIGSLQIKIAGLKQNRTSEVMDWGIKIISNQQTQNKP